MSLFKDLANTVVTRYNEKKEQDANDRAYVQNNEGSKAISVYMADLFKKGHEGYTWLKENKMPLIIDVEQDVVTLSYEELARNPQSFREAMPKKKVVGRYYFQQMYKWYGLNSSSAYGQLDTKVQRAALSGMIDDEIRALGHMKYTSGWEVKLFQ